MRYKMFAERAEGGVQRKIRSVWLLSQSVSVVLHCAVLFCFFSDFVFSPRSPERNPL